LTVANPRFIPARFLIFSACICRELIMGESLLTLFGGYVDFLRIVFDSASAAMLLPFQHGKQKAK